MALSKKTIAKMKVARKDNVEKASATVRKRSGRGHSGYKGVYAHRGRWQAKIKLKSGSQKSLGLFDTLEEAAKNYDFHSLKEYGSGNCYLNFPDFDYTHFIPLKGSAASKDTAIVSVDYNVKT